MRTWGLAAVLLGAWLFAPRAHAQFSALETEHLRLVYDEVNLGFVAPHAARCFENSLRFHRELSDYRPHEKITVILNDFEDFGNAAAGSTPRNTLLMGVAPISVVYETYPVNERLYTLFNHELVHIVALDRAVGSERFFRGLFRGKVRETPDHPETIFYGYLTNPRSSAPRWFHEGLAVFIETWMAGGIGRGQGAYDEMVFRAMVRDDARFYDPLGLLSEGVKVDFQVGANAYLYGTRFISYLAYVYSPEQVVSWASRGPGSKKYYASHFRRVFGKSIDDAWREWVEWEHDFQGQNLESVRQYPITPLRDLSKRALGSVSRGHYDPESRRIYVAVRYPGRIAHIAAISVDDGSIEGICDVKNPAMYFVTALAYDPEGRRLFYTADNFSHRDLCVVDLETGKSRVLIKDARVGDLVFNPHDRSLWGIRHYNGITTLVRIPEPYEEWNQIHSWPYGQMIYGLDCSTDGKRLSASLGTVGGRQSLIQMEMGPLLAGRKPDPQTLFEFDYTVPGNFVYSDDGRFLYGSSYYSGVSNLFRYNLEADSLEALSNCETGLFNPIPDYGDSLIAFRYSGQGFVPAVLTPNVIEDVSAVEFLGQKIAERHEVVRTWTVGSPAKVDIDRLTVRTGSYNGLGSIGVESGYPVVEGYKDHVAYGYRLNFSDPVMIHQASLTGSYTPNMRLPENERLHLEFDYKRYNLSLNAKYNGANFYDLVGPTKSSRKGYSVGLGYTRTLIYDEPRKMTFGIGATAYGDLERLPDAQNVSSSSDQLYTGYISLSFQNRRASLGAVDYEKGIEWEVEASSSLVEGEAFPRARANFDFGFPLPIHHTSLWIRSGGGYSPGDRDEPSANFYFGGFGNNWVDDGSVKRFRSYYALPGLELNEVGGTNFTRVVAELGLPPVRFRRFGVPALFVTWARPTLFGTGLLTNLDEADVRQEVGDVGAQLDLRLRVLHHLNFTASVGYAMAFREGSGPSDEFMFSLKVL